MNNFDVNLNLYRSFYCCSNNLRIFENTMFLKNKWVKK